MIRPQTGGPSRRSRYGALMKSPNGTAVFGGVTGMAVVSTTGIGAPSGAATGCGVWGENSDDSVRRGAAVSGVVITGGVGAPGTGAGLLTAAPAVGRPTPTYPGSFRIS